MKTFRYVVYKKLRHGKRYIAADGIIEDTSIGRLRKYLAGLYETGIRNVKIRELSA